MPVSRGTPKAPASKFPSVQAWSKWIKDNERGAAASKMLEAAKRTQLDVAKSLVGRKAASTGFRAKQTSALEKMLGAKLGGLDSAAKPWFGSGLNKDRATQNDAIRSMFSLVASSYKLPEDQRFTDQSGEVIDKPKNLNTSSAAGYDPFTDGKNLERIWEATANLDWTPIFRPPLGMWTLSENPSGLHALNSGVLILGGRTGYRWHRDGDAIGVIPGVGATVLDYEVATGRGLLNPFDSSFSAWTSQPASALIGAMVWRMLNVAGPDMYRIYPRGISGLWERYFEGARSFAEKLWNGTDGQPKNRAVARSIAHWSRWLDNQDPGTLGNPPSAKRHGVYGSKFSTSSVGIKSPSLEALVATFLDNLQLEQAKTLDTIVCAYVGPNYPALNDPDLALKHDQNRRALLRHKAVKSVELDLIPDADYRAAVAQAQRIGGDLSFDTGPEPGGPGFKAPSGTRRPVTSRPKGASGADKPPKPTVDPGQPPVGPGDGTKAGPGDPPEAGPGDPPALDPGDPPTQGPDAGPGDPPIKPGDGEGGEYPSPPKPKPPSFGEPDPPSDPTAPNEGDGGGALILGGLSIAALAFLIARR